MSARLPRRVVTKSPKARNSRASGPGSARPPPGRALLKRRTLPRCAMVLHDKLPHRIVAAPPAVLRSPCVTPQLLEGLLCEGSRRTAPLHPAAARAHTAQRSKGLVAARPFWIFEARRSRGRGDRRPLFVSGSWGLSGRGFFQGLIQISDQVICIFDPDGDAHHIGASACGDLLRLGQLAMRG
jgi:hypothetical protein